VARDYTKPGSGPGVFPPRGYSPRLIGIKGFRAQIIKRWSQKPALNRCRPPDFLPKPF